MKLVAAMVIGTVFGAVTFWIGSAGDLRTEVAFAVYVIMAGQFYSYIAEE